MDDPAQKKPSSLDPRFSGVKSIVGRRREREAPPLPRILESLGRAQQETSGFCTDETILDAYVQALRRLFPGVRFAMRLGSAGFDRARVVQAATHRIRDAAASEVSITEAAFLRAGLGQPVEAPKGMSLRRTYEPCMVPNADEELLPADGLDAPLTLNGAVIGVALAELDRGTELPARLEDALSIAAAQTSAAIETGRLRRESTHLRDYLDRLLEYANIPVLVTGRDRSIRVVSSAFESITGLDRRDLLAKDLLQLASQSERVRVLSAFVGVLRGRDVDPFELRLPKAGGGHSRLELSFAPILDSESRVAGVIAIGHDRTEVRELEGQVIHAEKLATLGQLAAGIVHEINNPLTSISVYGEYLLGKLRRTGAEQSDLKRVERILRSSDRIMSFTRNLLTYARPSKEEAQPLSLNDVVDEAIGFCEHIIREAHVSIERSYDPSICPVRGVGGQLHQVVVNLVTNACNAAPEEGGRLVLSTRRLGQDRVELAVEDNGVGIHESEIERVFEPFFSTRRKGQGTGLGLSIVRNIVQEHQGSIQIDSELGRGTVFKVTLPCQRG